jgi:hypothetical protein
MRTLTTIALASVLLLTLGSSDLLAGGGFQYTGESQGNSYKYSHNYFYNFFYHHFYQWMRDDDGDGIPNCQDPDWTKPEDGAGYGTFGGCGNGSGDCGSTHDQTLTRTRDGHRYMHVNGTGYQYRWSRDR